MGVSKNMKASGGVLPDSLATPPEIRSLVGHPPFRFYLTEPGGTGKQSPFEAPDLFPRWPVDMV